MLERLKVQDFKSFGEATVDLPRMAVLFGPNAVGKSNLLDAIQALSRIGTQRTLADALGEPIRGYPAEMFKLPVGGISQLLSEAKAQFSLEADLAIRDSNSRRKNSYRYRITVEIATGSGRLSNRSEFLAALNKSGTIKGKPAIGIDGDRLQVRRQSGGGRPRYEDLGQNYAILSDPRLGRPAHVYIERVRQELLDWQTYYLDPRLAMRAPMPPLDVRDIGVFGEYIAPYLYKLKFEEKTYFDSIVRMVRAIIPSVETIDVELDRRRGTIDLWVRQAGTDYSSRVVSEGTLRLLALCAITVNPWSGSLLAFEEPENGVHPRRINLIAQMLVSLALERERQVVVTTHSPLFCNAVLNEARSRSSDDLTLFNFRGARGGTEIQRFSSDGQLFDDLQISKALTSGSEDGLFEALVLRGFIDE